MIVSQQTSTLTEHARPRDNPCDRFCLVHEYNRDKIAAEGSPAVYMIKNSGIIKIPVNSQNTSPVISDEIIAELKFLGIDKETYVHNNFTKDDLAEIRSMHNDKTYENIAETAEYIKKNKITRVVEYLLDELYTMGFIEEFGNQYPELVKQSIDLPYM